MMDFKKIELADRAVLAPYLDFSSNKPAFSDAVPATLTDSSELADLPDLPQNGQNGVKYLSDINFTNLFIWRHAREISWAIVEGCLVIKTQYAGQEPYYFYPLSPTNAAAGAANATSDSAKPGAPGDAAPCSASPINALNELLKRDKNASFHSLLRADLRELDAHFKGRFETTIRRDRFEYIYKTSDLINLPGKAFHKKKNHLNRFNLMYPHAAFEFIDSANASEVAHTATAWFNANIKEQKSESLFFENRGIMDALNHFDELGLKGGLLRIDGHVAAFSIGENIDEAIALIHIEKADINYDGIYQAINQAFLRHAFSTTLFANREEDLGIEGLRKAKMSYRPSHLIHKYDIKFGI